MSSMAERLLRFTCVDNPYVSGCTGENNRTGGETSMVRFTELLRNKHRWVSLVSFKNVFAIPLLKYMSL